MTVTTSGGTSTTGAADQFTYLPGPPPPSQVATYRGDLARTGYYPSETGLTTANVTHLKLHWTATGGHRLVRPAHRGQQPGVLGRLETASRTQPI